MRSLAFGKLGSSGSYMELWQWALLIVLCCFCCVCIGFQILSADMRNPYWGFHGPRAHEMPMAFMQTMPMSMGPMQTMPMAMGPMAMNGPYAGPHPFQDAPPSYESYTAMTPSYNGGQPSFNAMSSFNNMSYNGMPPSSTGYDGMSPPGSAIMKQPPSGFAVPMTMPAMPTNGAVNPFSST